MAEQPALAPTLPGRAVGRTAVRVTALGFGAAPIGNLAHPVDPDEAAAAVDAAWDAGIRYFDTAPHYGLGLSERRLGAALAGRPRDEYVVSTKVGRLLVPNPHPRGSDLDAGGFAVPDTLVRELDYSADGVRRSLESSLERLGLDRVDVVLVHDPDDHVDQAVAETIPALVRLRDEGVVGAVGVGMNQWQAPLRMVRETDLDVVMLAGRWTLLDRTGEPLLDAAAERGVSVLAAAPYNSGLLARDEPPATATFNYAQAPDAVLESARALARTAREHGVRLPQAALQFPLRHPAVVSVVTGMRRAAHVTEAAALLREAVPGAAWEALTDAP
ncbi:MAG: aldo/keto reductase [Promicromonosporaceae bacterium]|nr:aldo/keto reductase [Promicromonosporaceae bacterium]